MRQDIISKFEEKAETSTSEYDMLGTYETSYDELSG